MNEILSLWAIHREASWPKFAGPHEGELMTLDTVISGCVTYYLDSEGGLDPQRVTMLETCLADLAGLLPELTGGAAEYFERLRSLTILLLNVHHQA